jgi:hypothetical protein
VVPAVQKVVGAQKVCDCAPLEPLRTGNKIEGKNVLNL